MLKPLFNLLSFTLLILPVIVFSAPEDLAVGSLVKVEVEQIHPSQGEVDGASIQKMGEQFETEAQTLSIPLTEHLQKALDKKPLPAVIMPDGGIWIADGHHRATLVARWEKQGRFMKGEVDPVVQIKKNYKELGYSLEQALIELYKENSLFFPKELREKITLGKITLTEAVKSFVPSQLYDLRNNPKRGAVGVALHHMRFEGDDFANFSQFYVVEWLEERGFKFPKVISLEDKTLMGCLREEFQKPAFLDYMRQIIRPGKNFKGEDFSVRAHAWIKSCASTLEKISG